jgi:hypothetical protein
MAIDRGQGQTATQLTGSIFPVPVALTTVQTAANQVAHLALTAQEGDVVVRSDENNAYMHNGGSAGTMGDYTLISTTTTDIATIIEAASDSNTFTDADHSKLNAIEESATADQTAAEIKTLLEDGINTVHIGDDQVTTDKLADSINTAITANTAKVTNATHTGEVTGATTLTIANNIVDEANLKVSNSPTNGYSLTAQSGNTGGLTWADISSGGGSTAGDGADSIAIGTSADSDGANSIAIGNGAMADSNYTIAIGKGVGNTSSDVTYNTHNVLIGVACGESLNGASSIEGFNNVCLGYYAGKSITTGSNNVCIGWQSGEYANAITTGDRNTCIGYGSGIAEQFGSPTDGTIDKNTSIGSDTYGGTKGTQVGFYSYAAEESVAVGNEAWAKGDNCIAIGNLAGTSSSPHEILEAESNRVVIGDDNITNAYIKVSWTVTSDERDKADIIPMTYGLNVIENISPINYVWDVRTNYWEKTEEESKGRGLNEVITKHDSDGSKKQSGNLRTGFSAQNVKAALDAVAYEGNSVVDSTDPDNLKITETNLIPFLVNAVKELSAKVEALEKA